MAARLRRLAAIRQQDPLVREVIWGIHIEGPFINETPGYVGAHPRQSVRPADVETMKRLLDAAGGLTRLVTLAPERDPGMKVIRHLVRQKVLVSAGHCNPSLDELRAAIDAGLSMFTHLGNGCPTLLDRHDNIIQRVLSLRERLTICFIADGVHIPPMAEKLLAAGRHRALGRGYRRHFCRPAGTGALCLRITVRGNRRGPDCPLARPLVLRRLYGDDAADGRGAFATRWDCRSRKSSGLSPIIRGPCCKRHASGSWLLRPKSEDQRPVPAIAACVSTRSRAP